MEAVLGVPPPGERRWAWLSPTGPPGAPSSPTPSSSGASLGIYVGMGKGAGRAGRAVGGSATLVIGLRLRPGCTCHLHAAPPSGAWVPGWGCCRPCSSAGYAQRLTRSCLAVPVGLVAGVVLVLGAIAGVVTFLRFHKRRQQARRAAERQRRLNPGGHCTARSRVLAG